MDFGYINRIQKLPVSNLARVTKNTRVTKNLINFFFENRKLKDQRNYEKRSHTLCKGGKTHVRRKIFTDNFILHIDLYLHNILITKKICIYQNK